MRSGGLLVRQSVPSNCEATAASGPLRLLLRPGTGHGNSNENGQKGREQLLSYVWENVSADRAQFILAFFYSFSKYGEPSKYLMNDRDGGGVGVCHLLIL